MVVVIANIQNPGHMADTFCDCASPSVDCPPAPLRGRQSLSGLQDMPGSQDWAGLPAKMLSGGALLSHVDGLSGRNEAASEGEFAPSLKVPCWPAMCF